MNKTVTDPNKFHEGYIGLSPEGKIVFNALLDILKILICTPQKNKE